VRQFLQMLEGFLLNPLSIMRQVSMNWTIIPVQVESKQPVILINAKASHMQRKPNI